MQGTQNQESQWRENLSKIGVFVWDVAKKAGNIVIKNPIPSVTAVASIAVPAYLTVVGHYVTNYVTTRAAAIQANAARDAGTIQANAARDAANVTKPGEAFSPNSLLAKKLIDSNETISETQKNLIKADLFTTLRSLDNKGKGHLIRFLDEGGFVKVNKTEIKDSKSEIKDNKIKISLSGADLQKIDLHNAWLPDINLKGAYLSGGILKNTNLKRADLREARLNNADLTRAKLTDANLTGADLRGTDLRFAELKSHTLSNANLEGACYVEGTEGAYFPPGFKPETRNMKPISIYISDPSQRDNFKSCKV